MTDGFQGTFLGAAVIASIAAVAAVVAIKRPRVVAAEVPETAPAQAA
jgi:hypothetical protein